MKSGMRPVELQSEERVALDDHAVKRAWLPCRPAAWEPPLLLSG